MIDFATVASRCNEDYRFEQAGWQESAATIALLMASEAFLTTLERLVPIRQARTLEANVATVYACRLIEERAKGRKVREGLLSLGRHAKTAPSLDVSAD